MATPTFYDFIHDKSITPSYKLRVLALSIAIASLNVTPSEEFDKEISEQAQVFSKKLWVYSELNHTLIYQLLYEMQKLCDKRNKKNIIDELFKDADSPEMCYRQLVNHIETSLSILGLCRIENNEPSKIGPYNQREVVLELLLIGVLLGLAIISGVISVPFLLLAFSTSSTIVGLPFSVLAGGSAAVFTVSFFAAFFQTFMVISNIIFSGNPKVPENKKSDAARDTIVKLHPPESSTHQFLTSKAAFFKDDFASALRIQGLNYHKQNHEPHRRDSWSSSV
jgi:hypothetical protein